MRKAGFCVACIVVCLIALGNGGQSSQSGRRTISYSKGRQIAPQLRPDDVEVTLDLMSTAPLTVAPPAGKTWLQWMTDLAHLILVVRAEGVQPFLEPAGDAISSRVTFRVLEAVKVLKEGDFRSGQTFDWVTRGGTMKVDGRIVHAVVRWAKEVVVRENYLLFANVDPADNKLVIGPGGLYEVTERGLESMVVGQVHDGITGRPVGVVTKDIRQYLNTGR